VRDREPEIVVRHESASFAFSLPDGHELELLEERDGHGRQLARLGIPGAMGETCVVTNIADRGDELEYTLEPSGLADAVGHEPSGYPWPAVQDEHERIRRRWGARGGDPGRLIAWREGASYGAQFEEWRAEIRRLEQRVRSRRV